MFIGTRPSSRFHTKPSSPQLTQNCDGDRPTRQTPAICRRIKGCGCFSCLRASPSLLAWPRPHRPIRPAPTTNFLAALDQAGVPYKSGAVAIRTAKRRAKLTDQGHSQADVIQSCRRRMRDHGVGRDPLHDQRGERLHPQHLGEPTMQSHHRLRRTRGRPEFRGPRHRLLSRTCRRWHARARSTKMGTVWPDWSMVADPPREWRLR